MATETKTNVLYFGDNLDILRKYIPDESIDLIYLDPPFNSNRDYNILFKENGGLESEAQIKAFSDTWHWSTKSAQSAYHDVVLKGPPRVGQLLESLYKAIGGNDVMAYLAMMTIRLIELHRALKPTGSLYLHCDTTASHYLKIVLDQIFGPVNFRNEIVWKRTSAHSDAKRYSKVSDSILFYSKSDNFVWNSPRTKYDEAYLESHYRNVDGSGRRFTYSDLVKPRGSVGYFYTLLECQPPPNGWRMPEITAKQWIAEGRVEIPKDGRVPRYKRYLDEMSGAVITNVWDDISPINSQAKERLGFDTQKPLALLERIIQASSNEGDVVLDPFCGCGTAVVAAEKLKRKWIGIDITYLAINLMRNRLRDSYGIKSQVIGEPTVLSEAKALAKQDRYQFQYWALDKIGAWTAGEKKKGADKGIDGFIRFKDDGDGNVKYIMIQVKSGHVGVNVIRELKAVSEKAAMGVLLTLEPPTEPMKIEAVDAGLYYSPLYKKEYPKIQIITIEELFQGKTVEMPPQSQTNVTLPKAPKMKKKEGTQIVMEAAMNYEVNSPDSE